MSQEEINTAPTGNQQKDKSERRNGTTNTQESTNTSTYRRSRPQPPHKSGGNDLHHPKRQRSIQTHHTPAPIQRLHGSNHSRPLYKSMAQMTTERWSATTQEYDVSVQETTQRHPITFWSCLTYLYSYPVGHSMQDDVPDFSVDPAGQIKLDLTVVRSTTPLTSRCLMRTHSSPSLLLRRKYIARCVRVGRFRKQKQGVHTRGR